MKQEIPETKGTSLDLSKLSPEEMKVELAKFQEALKGDAFKDINAYEALGLEAPKADTSEERISQANRETIDRLLPAYNKVREELASAGFDFKSSDSKMSEAEKEIHVRLEKQATAKFAEQKAEVTKIDPDFPTEIIEGLKISTDDKTIVMAGVKEVVSRNSEAVQKLKDELTKVTSELQTVKLSAPKEDEPEALTGDNKVSAAIAKFGLKVETEEKTE